MDRRELFRSLSSSFSKKADGRQEVIRPPYCDENSSFDKECMNCDGRCATFCEENIIVIQEDKTPKLDFKLGGCTYCDECAKACEPNVLDIGLKSNIQAKFEIDLIKCLSWNNVMCFSCKDPCLDDAIEFIAMFRPSITDKCTSCGFCLNICPTEAITYK